MRRVTSNKSLVRECKVGKIGTNKSIVTDGATFVGEIGKVEKSKSIEHWKVRKLAS